MSIHRVCGLLLAGLSLATQPAGALEPIRIQEGSYQSGGLFARPVLPVEQEAITVTVRAQGKAGGSGEVPAMISIIDSMGVEVAHLPLSLKPAGDVVEGCVQWSSAKNGIFVVRAELQAMEGAELDAKGVKAEMILPVVNKARRPDFLWYNASSEVRWATVIACASNCKCKSRPCKISCVSKAVGRFHERGITALGWSYGGGSWYGASAALKKEGATPEALKTAEEKLFQMWSGDTICDGMGLDEFGGYPLSDAEQFSIAGGKALLRARQKCPNRIFAVWQGGGIREAMLGYYRNAADFLLLECYLGRAVPQELGTENIYAYIHGKLEPFLRGTDMLLPVYGNRCRTLVALDTSERPDWIEPGEMEQVVRYIRQNWPELRGMAWYNAGFGGYGLKITPETTDIHRQILQKADQLSYDYFIKPCLTLLPNSLWIAGQGTSRELTVAISNIGAVDSGNVKVEFWVDGQPVATVAAPSVPAGANRLQNRVILRHLIELKPGTHHIEARILQAEQSTVLEPTVSTDVFW